MSSPEIRLECLRLAAGLVSGSVNDRPGEIKKLADDFVNFVESIKHDTLTSELPDTQRRKSSSSKAPH